MRLARADGHEESVIINEPTFLLMCYLGFLLTWFLVRQLGWRLTTERNAPILNQLSLRELMAITAIVAVLLWSYRDCVRPTQFRLSDFIGVNRNERVEMVLGFTVLFATFGGLILGLLSRRMIWIVAWSVLLGIAYFFLWIQIGFDPFFVSFGLPVAMTVGVGFVARLNGYRVTRRSETPEAADALVSAVDQAS